MFPFPPRRWTVWLSITRRILPGRTGSCRRSHQRNRSSVAELHFALPRIRPCKSPAFIAEQFTFQQTVGEGRTVDGHKGCCCRLLFLWRRSATSSLPVPVSPVMRVVVSVEADLPRDALIFCICELSPIKGDKPGSYRLRDAKGRLRAAARETAVDTGEQVFAGERLFEIINDSCSEGSDGEIFRAVCRQ